MLLVGRNAGPRCPAFCVCAEATAELWLDPHSQSLGLIACPTDPNICLPEWINKGRSV
jgi:hypothetical protein